MLTFDDAKQALDDASKICGFDFWAGTVGIADVQLLLSLKNGVSAKAKRMMKSKRSYHCSDPAFRDRLQEFTEKLSHLDPNLLPSLTNKEYLFRYENRTCEIGKACYAMLQAQNVHSRYALTLPIPGHSKMVYRFYFMSALNESELEQRLQQTRMQLVAAAHMFVAYSADMEDMLNPVYEMQFVNDKSKQVLECLKQGMTRTEISQHLHMTSRGVDYHVSRLKEFFGASNLANLVVNAGKYGV